MTSLTAADRADPAFADPAFKVHAACLFDLVDTSLLPPPAECYALDITDAAVQRLTVFASLASTAFAVAGMLLAASAG